MTIQTMTDELKDAMERLKVLVDGYPHRYADEEPLMAEVERLRTELADCAENHYTAEEGRALEAKLAKSEAVATKVRVEIEDALRIATDLNAAADKSSNGPELALLEVLSDAITLLEEDK